MVLFLTRKLLASHRRSSLFELRPFFRLPRWLSKYVALAKMAARGVAMAYWIVYQGDSWKRARRGGYIWVPKVAKNGKTPAHWATMKLVLPGDLIFSGVDNALRAVAEVTLPE